MGKQSVQNRYRKGTERVNLCARKGKPLGTAAAVTFLESRQQFMLIKAVAARHFNWLQGAVFYFTLVSAFANIKVIFIALIDD